jgi:hypothetical protein
MGDLAYCKRITAEENMTTRREFLAATAGGLALSALPLSGPAARPIADPIQPVKIPEWVYNVTKMAYLNPGEIAKAAKAGVQVVHTNVVWPYFPLRKDGGGLPKEEDKQLRQLVEDCHKAGIKLCLGLPPFPPVELVKARPDWRVHPDDTGAVLKLVPEKDNLGTRIGCNLGPWGDYLIEVCAELVQDYKVDGYSFDGNYHAPLCFCPACKNAYKEERGKTLPPKIDLDNIAYREYLVWRGEKLEDHYRRLQGRLKKIDPNAVVMSWTVNAGRYGHFLYSPRAMPTRLNRLFDLPMQELWLDETNFGGSVAPAFGAAYLRGTTGDRPNASEAYLMSRGNPYSSDSFPKHERLARTFLAMTNGGLSPKSFGWTGHAESTAAVFQAISQRERWLTRTERLPWAALLVSEQTRQFYAYKDIAERFLPSVYGVFRAAMEEHLPLSLINDWDLTKSELAKYRVLILANAAALSNEQAEAVRQYVREGGGLVATTETSLFDELGRPRPDFALADVFGVSYLGRPKAPDKRPELDANFAITVNEDYWKQRTGVATLSWTEASPLRDPRLDALIPNRSTVFRGPLVTVSEPKNRPEVIMALKPEGWTKPDLPGGIMRSYGKGHVIYLAAGIDAALWSYAYPYERRMLTRVVELAAGEKPSIQITAPMCVQTTFFTQKDGDRKRLLIHIFNGINSTANHGFPAMDVPLREETVPIHGIKVEFAIDAPKRFHLEPGNIPLKAIEKGNGAVVELPPLELHAILVGEQS